MSFLLFPITPKTTNFNFAFLSRISLFCENLSLYRKVVLHFVTVLLTELSKEKSLLRGITFGWIDSREEVLTGPSLKRISPSFVMLGSSSGSRDTQAQFSELECVSSWREIASVSTAFVNPAFGILALISSAGRLLRPERFGAWVAEAVSGIIRGDYKY